MWFPTPPTQHQSTSPSTATTLSKHNGESKQPPIRHLYARPDHLLVQNSIERCGVGMDSSDLLWMTRTIG